MHDARNLFFLESQSSPGLSFDRTMIVFALFLALATRNAKAADACVATPHPPQWNCTQEIQFDSSLVQTCPSKWLRCCNCCCVANEAAIEQFAERILQLTVDCALASLVNTFTYLYETFSVLIDKAIEKSRNRTVDLFASAYGLYFTDDELIDFLDPLFDAIRAFIFTRKGDVDASLNEMRDALAIKAFKIIANLNELKPDDATCILNYVRWAGETDEGLFRGKMAFLRRLVHRAVNVSTAIVIGLEVGKRVSDLTGLLCPTCACRRDVARLIYCSSCVGLRPCFQQCKNILLGSCLGDLMKLNDALNEYLGILSKLFVEVSNISPTSLLQDIGTQVAFSAMELVKSLMGAHGERIKSACGFVSREKRSHTYDESSGQADFNCSLTPPKEMQFDKQLNFARAAISHLRNALPTLTLAENMCEMISSKNVNTCWNGTDSEEYTSSSKTKASHCRQQILRSLMTELHRASRIMNKWNQLNHWKIKPTRRACCTKAGRC